MDTQTTKTKPGESSPPTTTTSATTTTPSGLVAAMTTAAPETSNNTKNAPLPQPPSDNEIQSGTQNAANLAAPEPAVTSSARNSTSSIEIRRLSDRALPPLPPSQVQVQQHRDAGPVVDVPVTEEPPPEYMSIPHNNNAAQRSGGAGGRPPQRPENYVINPEDLYEQPDYVDCPHCRTRQKTIVRHQPTTETNMAAVACCLCCGILPGIIPFCCNWFNDIEHVCPNCVKVVARMPHDGKMQAVLPQASKYQASSYQASQFQPAAGGAAGTTSAAGGVVRNGNNNANASAAGNSNGDANAGR